jgi:cofilin
VISLDDNAHHALNDMRIGKGHCFAIFKFNENNSKIILHKASQEEEGYEEFIESLPKDDVAYGIYQFKFDVPDGTRRSRDCFVTWIPKESNRIKKFVAANSKRAIHSQMNGNHVDFTANSLDEISLNDFFDKCITTIH